MKRQIAEREINFYTIDATAIAMELGLGNRTNTVLQAAFFNLSGIIPIEDAVEVHEGRYHQVLLQEGPEDR